MFSPIRNAVVPPAVRCLFSQTIQDNFVRVPEGFPVIRWNCLNLLGHRRCPSDKLDALHYMTRGACVVLPDVLSWPRRRAEVQGAWERIQKCLFEPVLHFCLSHRDKKDSEEQVAGQMTWSAAWDPAKIAHLVSSDCCDECCHTATLSWAVREQRQVHVHMGVLFCFTLKISRGKKQNRLPECVYGGWPFAPVRISCPLDFTIAVLISIITYWRIY